MPTVPWSSSSERARHAEVHERDPALAEDEVLRLHVAVDDLLLVHVLERLCGLADVVDRVLDGQARPPVLLEHPAQVGALHELHHEVLAGVVEEVVDDPHDPRVPELGEQARLDLEAGRMAHVHKPLDGHLAALALVRSAIDGAHCAARYRAQNLVAALQLEPGSKIVNGGTVRHAPSLALGSANGLGGDLRGLLRVPPRRRLSPADRLAGAPQARRPRERPRPAARARLAHRLVHARVRAGARLAGRRDRRRRGGGHRRADRRAAPDPGRRPRSSRRSSGA